MEHIVVIIQGGIKMVDSKVTRSIRADAETIDRFKELSNQFVNQGECLETLIRAYEMDNAKSIEEEMKSDIRSFESHTNALYSLYLSAIEKIVELKKRIGRLTGTIDELNKKIADYESVGNCDENETPTKEADIKRFRNIGELCAINRDLTAEIEKYKNENTELSAKINTMTKENAELSAQIAKLTADLQISDKQNEFELIKALNEKEAQHLKKMSEIMELKDKMANEIYELKKELMSR